MDSCAFAIGHSNHSWDVFISLLLQKLNYHSSKCTTFFCSRLWLQFNEGNMIREIEDMIWAYDDYMNAAEFKEGTNELVSLK